MRDILDPLIFPAPGNRSGEIFRFIVTEQFRHRASRALAGFSEAGLLAQEEAESLVEKVRAGSLRAEPTWHFSAGLFDDQKEAERQAGRCLDQLMLCLGAAGVTIEHRFLAADARLYLPDGRILQTESLAGFQAKGGEVSLEWRPGRRNGVAVLPSVVAGDGRLQFMTRDFAEDCFTASIEHLIAKTGAFDPTRFADCLAEVERHAPPFRRWCAAAISSIIPIDPGVKEMVSGSQGACPGQIYLSAGLDSVKTAEMLIHEASHQYFRAIESVTRLTLAGSAEEFYSPVARRHRPLQKLLLGFHAFANVLLYMKQALPGLRGADRAFAASNIASVEHDLAELREGIDASTTLTEPGAYLWSRMKAVAQGA